MSETVRIEQPAELVSLYDTILTDSFPPHELISRDELLDGVRDGGMTVLAALSEDGVTAVAITSRLSPGVALLSYFATREDQRGRGVGGALLSALLGEIAQTYGLVLAEVENPSHHAAHPQYGDPVARLRFYERVGARIVDVPYFQPPVASDAAAVYGMLLLALTVDPAIERAGLLAADSGLADALETLMQDADPGRFPVEPLIEAARGEVRLLPIADVARAAVAVAL